jgi:hypothetical protein
MIFDELLDKTMELPLDEREELISIIQKRNDEEKREELAEYYKKELEKFKKGKAKPMTFQETIQELEKNID